MKIEIEIPDWCKDRHIYIMAGIELAAYKQKGQAWKIKSSRCSECGKCCEDIPDGFPPSDKNGVCIYLVNDGKNKRVCSLGINRPFRCCIGSSANLKECTEKYDTVL